MHFRGEAQVRQLLLIIGVCLFLPLTAPAVHAPPKSTPAIVVDGDRDYPPYEFIDRNGAPSGYNVERRHAEEELLRLNQQQRLQSECLATGSAPHRQNPFSGFDELPTFSDTAPNSLIILNNLSN